MMSDLEDRISFRRKLASYIKIDEWDAGDQSDTIYAISLKVHHQEFRLSAMLDSKEDAHWMREMLVIALERMVNEVTK